LSPAVRVHVVDPSAYTPPYDRALCRSLAAAGADVTLFTSRFAYGPRSGPPAGAAGGPADGYVCRELFYRAALGRPGSRLRSASKLAQHVPDMLRYRRAARAAQIVHFQWLAVQQLDVHLLPVGGAGARARVGPRLVLTAHDVLPREPRPGQRAAQQRLYQHMDAIVVHSHHGRARLIGELGVAPERVHVIAHGVLRPWEDTPDAATATAMYAPGTPAGVASDAAPQAALESVELPPELAGTGPGPVALFFGLLRPYKGLDELLEAWGGLAGRLPSGSELWIVGMPRMELEPLREAARLAAREAARAVRVVGRYVSDHELHALMRRADLVVLPYREIEQSGVVFTALGAGVPLLLSDVGGFPEIAATGAARTFAAGVAPALRDALAQLLGDPATLSAMAERARAAAGGPYAWEGIAARTLALYQQLLRQNHSR
jgi:glycosyltransferase involved in cell wall biosynthesis